MIDLSISFYVILRGYYSKKNAIYFFFLIFFIYLLENVRCYKGEHVFPNGTISLTIVSIFILEKKKKKNLDCVAFHLMFGFDSAPKLF